MILEKGLFKDTRIVVPNVLRLFFNNTWRTHWIVFKYLKFRMVSMVSLGMLMIFVV